MLVKGGGGGGVEAKEATLAVIQRPTYTIVCFTLSFPTQMYKLG